MQLRLSRAHREDDNYVTLGYVHTRCSHGGRLGTPGLRPGGWGVCLILSPIWAARRFNIPGPRFGKVGGRGRCPHSATWAPIPRRALPAAVFKRACWAHRPLGHGPGPGHDGPGGPTGRQIYRSQSTSPMEPDMEADYDTDDEHTDQVGRAVTDKGLLNWPRRPVWAPAPFRSVSGSGRRTDGCDLTEAHVGLLAVDGVDSWAPKCQLRTVTDKGNPTV